MLILSKTMNESIEKEKLHHQLNEYKDKYESAENVVDVYTNFHDYYAPQLRIYFMSIYQILKYVHDKEENKEIANGSFYTNILRAQLLNSELMLLFLNCLSEELGSDKFKPLVEKYAFFEHLSPKKINTIITYEDITKYKLEAFGTNEHYTGIHKSYSKK